MPQYLKALFFQQGPVTFILFQVGKFNERVTADALRVMMGFLIIGVFEMMVLVTESRLADNPCFKQFMKAAVNGRTGNLADVFFALFDQFLSGKVAVCVHGLIKNGPTSFAKT